MKTWNATLFTAFAMIFVLAGCPKQDAGTEVEEPTTPATPVEPAEPAEPVEPAEPEPPPPPEVTALDDEREATWGGKLGAIEEIKWIVATEPEGEGASILVYMPSGDGAMWVKTASEGEFTVGEEGVLVTEGGELKIVAYEPVPVEIVDMLKVSIQKTPIPKKATEEGEGLLTIRVSSEGAHVTAHVKGTLSPEVKPPKGKKPPKPKASKNLGAMAQKIAEACIMQASEAEGGEEGEEEGEEGEEEE
jgi:hypothetical protein